MRRYLYFAKRAEPRLAGRCGPASWQARFDTRQISTARISAVQYVKFPLTAEQRARWRHGARIVVNHQRYAAETVLTPDRLAELENDFQ